MASNQLHDEESFRPGIGHNQPPLEEQLSELLAPHVESVDAIVEVAKTARIIDGDDLSVSKVIDVERKSKALWDDLEKLRKATKEPFLVSGRLVDMMFVKVTEVLRIVHDDMLAMIEAQRKKREEERQRWEAEQRQRETEAEAARLAAEEKNQAGSAATAEKLVELQARDAARAAAARAASASGPLQSDLGQVGVHRIIRFEITDLKKCIAWMWRQRALRTQFEDAVRDIVRRHLGQKEVGVTAVERGVDIPGVNAWVEKKARVRS